MGLEVGWNCAISLRDLDEGEVDDHRMPSNYADWDVNAKLPHGITEVRQHLELVDDVPLLVGLYTDVTCSTTKEMVSFCAALSNYYLFLVTKTSLGGNFPGIWRHCSCDGLSPWIKKY